MKTRKFLTEQEIFLRMRGQAVSNIAVSEEEYSVRIRRAYLERNKVVDEKILYNPARLQEWGISQGI